MLGFSIFTWVIIVLGFVFSGFRIVMEYERGVVFRLGRIRKTRTAGITWIIPGLERMVKLGMRTIAMDVPPQDVITKDNVSVKVNAVVYFRVMDPDRAIVQVEDYLYAISQLSQTTLRSVLGQFELDQLLSEREQINMELQTILDKQTDAWGIKISTVELKHIDLPEEMRRAMARQAEAERERRAKVIAADGEFQASQKIHEASVIMSQNPVAIQLRYLQTLTEISSEGKSTTVIPIPIDLISQLLKKGRSE